MGSVLMLMAIGGLFAFLFIVVGLVLYVLFAIGLYGLAKTEKTGNEWFAFIPILQLYAVGKILKTVNVGKYTIPQLELVLPLAPVAVMVVNAVLGGIPIIGALLAALLGIACIVFFIIVMYNFYRRYKGDGATLMTVLSVVLFFMGPIYMFNLRNAKPLEDKVTVEG